MEESSFVVVQFSTDGTLIIAHSSSLNSYSYSSSIVVFAVATGAVKSARLYSSGASNNYNKLINSMVVSSGQSPMAYVLSNI
jgi:hypothetical protein